MIRTVQSGTYILSESKHGIKLLKLKTRTYAWIVAPRIGSLLIYSELPHVEQEILSEGRYHMYQVTDEVGLSNQLHLELEFAPDMWQGYILPGGLPTRLETRRRVIPTEQIITRKKPYSQILHRQRLLHAK